MIQCVHASPLGSSNQRQLTNREYIYSIGQEARFFPSKNALLFLLFVDSLCVCVALLLFLEEEAFFGSAHTRHTTFAVRRQQVTSDDNSRIARKCVSRDRIFQQATRHDTTQPHWIACSCLFSGILPTDSKNNILLERQETMPSPSWHISTQQQATPQHEYDIEATPSPKRQLPTEHDDDDACVSTVQIHLTPPRNNNNNNNNNKTNDTTTTTTTTTNNDNDDTPVVRHHTALSSSSLSLSAAASAAPLTDCMTATSTSWLLDNDTDDDTDDDDADSTTSVPYYDSTDFTPSHWTNDTTVPTVGFAVLGLAFAITHPILFLGAALATAVGTAGAYHGYYDCLVDGGVCAEWMQQQSSSSSRSGNANNSAGAVPEEERYPPVTQQQQQQLVVLHNHHVKSPTTTTTSETLAEVSTADSSTVSATSTDEPILTTTTTTTTTTDNDGEPTVPHEPLSQMQEDATADHANDNNDDDDEHFWNQRYPPLDKTIVTNHLLLGLNVWEVFEVFFADDAVYHFKEFQKQRGDLQIQYGSWQPDNNNNESSPHANDDHDHHHHHTAAAATVHHHQHRVLRFQAKTNNGIVGPAFADTTKTQRFHSHSKRFGVLEMKTVLHNIPYAQQFYILEQWKLVATKHKSSGPHNQQQQQHQQHSSSSSSLSYYTTAVTVSTGVVFTGYCPWESAVRHKSAAALRDVVTAWCGMATHSLELARQAKWQRLQQEQQQQAAAVTEPNNNDAEQQQQQHPIVLSSSSRHDDDDDNDDRIEVELSLAPKEEEEENNVVVPAPQQQQQPPPRRPLVGSLRRSVSSMFKPRMAEI